MRSMLLILAGLFLFSTTPLPAQVCGDLNGDNVIDLVDLVYMLNEHTGGPAIPSGKGDIDFRQDYNVGDTRFLLDYLFGGGGVPGCPPFSPYTLASSNDSLFLPSYLVPAGSGQFVLPIFMLNHADVADMVLPFTITGMGATVFLDSLRLSSTIMSHGIGAKQVSGSSGVIAFSLAYSWSEVFTPGLNLLAEAYLHYTSSPGGVISMELISKVV